MCLGFPSLARRIRILTKVDTLCAGWNPRNGSGSLETLAVGAPYHFQEEFAGSASPGWPRTAQVDRMNLRFPLTALHYHALAAFSPTGLPLATECSCCLVHVRRLSSFRGGRGRRDLEAFWRPRHLLYSHRIDESFQPARTAFDPDDLHQLIADNHEVANHTFSHVSCASVRSSAFQEEVRKGRAAIEAVTGAPRLRQLRLSFRYGHAESS